MTGLTPHQVKDIQSSWAKVRGERYAMVGQVFAELFNADSSLQAKFADFADVPLAALPSNVAFNNQVRLVADRLDAIIADLNTPLKLGGQLRYMAFSHKSRGVLRQQFQDFTTGMSKQLVAKGVSADDMESWKGAIPVLVNRIAQIQGL